MPSFAFFVKSNKPVIILTLATLILASLPILAVAFKAGASWRGVPPSFNDGYYYYQRIREIKDGYPFMGNPFFWEHRLELAPAFFFGDWLAAWPMLLGFSISFTLAFDIIFWSLIFSWLFYVFLSQVGLSKGFSAAGALLAYIAGYSLLLRPVSMQVVFPFFALFSLAFVVWFRRPSDKKRIIFLIIATTLAFYVYTYLWQIALGWLLLTGVYFLAQKNKSALAALGISLGASLALASPLIFYTLEQLRHQNYWESIGRVGLVQTHLPLANAAYISFWLVAGMAFWWAGRRWLAAKDDFFNLCFRFFTLSGVTMILVSVSNFITGKEMEISQHVEKFVVLWLAAVLISATFLLWRRRQEFRGLSTGRKIIILSLFLICFLANMRYLNQYFIPVAVINNFNQNAADIQSFAEPLNWLEANEKTPKVIWADNPILNEYVTISTKHYVLFSFNGCLHLMPSAELEERYLATHYFDNLTLDGIKQDLGDYGGVGNQFHQYKAHNRYVRLCRLLRLDLWGKNCGKIEDAFSWKGEDYFAGMLKRYQSEIWPQISAELNKFKVAYILKDSNYKSDFRPETIPGTVLVYQSQDGRFMIYRLSADH